MRMRALMRVMRMQVLFVCECAHHWHAALLLVWHLHHSFSCEACRLILHSRRMTRTHALACECKGLKLEKEIETWNTASNGYYYLPDQGSFIYSSSPSTGNSGTSAAVATTGSSGTSATVATTGSSGTSSSIAESSASVLSLCVAVFVLI